MTDFQIRTFRHRCDLDSALAARLEQAFTAAGAESHAVMLTGGNTPLPAYRVLGARLRQEHGSKKINDDLFVLYTDERYVPADAEASNYRQSRVLVDELCLSEAQLLRVRTELPLAEATQDYEQRLRNLLDSGIPISFGLLGLGADGHIASLFSEQDLERARGRLAIAVQRPDGMSAISVMPEVLRRTDQLLLVVAEAEKRTALSALLAHDPKLVASQALMDCGTIEIWCPEELLSTSSL